MEKLKEVTEEQKKFAVDATVTLVVEELSEELALSPATVLKDFIESKTGTLLYDETSKLWWNGPSYIVDLYKEEIHNKLATRNTMSDTEFDATMLSGLEQAKANESVPVGDAFLGCKTD